ncbi:hypothetical protein GE21DRAFT_4527 [Neurospora crassa]|uniref:Uncharacterized protein n=1 Tax=Neurospora crassa (strain ATCC 24698 / 74-OR23-1A / CBS 708.71 / DSM 1257 / FGSC 987) TaxID=367110 RepID=U9W4Z4_NEUCR|nr:hypothetical protein NCU00224 [Neurospora crassa OR74A]ESA43314.1 hypothetical protein NCU00224 [Neurospora crassa OR74A]KHE89689.1 hypothetical protein GE21DRAFT_4527 [Neurospora crassa]|eukprot:XP_011393794.1 hypothetical protein NCU00224 [Neurospora crassa OR74A]
MATRTLSKRKHGRVPAAALHYSNTGQVGGTGKISLHYKWDTWELRGNMLVVNGVSMCHGLPHELHDQTEPSYLLKTPDMSHLLSARGASVASIYIIRDID